MARPPKTQATAVRPGDEASISQQVLSVVFHSFTEDEMEAIRSRLMDSALGIRIALAAPRERGPRADEEYEGVREDDHGNVWHVYSRPPNPQLLNLLFNHAVGRPGQRKLAQQDPIIEVRHFVPGFVHVPSAEEERSQGTPDGAKISAGADGSWAVRGIPEGEGSRADQKTTAILSRIRDELAVMGDAIPTPGDDAAGATATSDDGPLDLGIEL